MKRFLVLILASLLAISLAACGDTQPAVSAPAADAPTTSEAATEAPTEAATEAPSPEETEPEDLAAEEDELVEGVDYLLYLDMENSVQFAYPPEFAAEGEPDEFGYMNFAGEAGTATMLYWATPNTYDEDIAAFMDRVFNFEPLDIGNNMVIGMGESMDQETGEVTPAAYIWLVEPDLIANVQISSADMDEAAAWFDRLFLGEFALVRDNEGSGAEDAAIPGEDPPYWNGLDMGPNAGYAEEIPSEADPGPFLNAAEAAKETFNAMKANGNIPEYSDDTEYVMTLVEITDVEGEGEGEGCYVYRLDVDEPTGTVGAAYAYAYSSGTIYMQGQGGVWVIPA